MSLSILEENWNQIMDKVVNKLWLYKFKSMYESCKLDKDDFDSLASVVLTDAFKTYDASESNIYTYASNVLQRKAKTELTFYHRQCREGYIYAESIQAHINEDGDFTLENLVIDKTVDDAAFNADMIEKEMLTLIKTKKDKQIIDMSIAGYHDVDIAQAIGVTLKEINAIREQLRQNCTIRRALRKMGYSLGGIEL